MPFEETKVYFDGGHYIAIQRTTRQGRRRKNQPEETIVFEGEKRTRKEVFDELYTASEGTKKREIKAEILERMGEHFESEQEAAAFVEDNFQRRKRTFECRRIRLLRKAALQEFNYFCTFTYDPQKMDEVDFQKKLSNVFWHMSNRQGWRYIGVWERSPEAKRLHFHGIFYIPDGTLPGELEDKSDYSLGDRKRLYTKQCTYFAERFGRNVFAQIDKQELAGELHYMLKYIEKSGERIVYSKGLPQFFISDIMDEDVVCEHNPGDRKLILFDDFACYDQGEYKGQVAPEVIAEMRKEN